MAINVRPQSRGQGGRGGGTKGEKGRPHRSLQTRKRPPSATAVVSVSAADAEAVSATAAGTEPVYALTTTTAKEVSVEREITTAATHRKY